MNKAWSKTRLVRLTVDILKISELSNDDDDGGEIVAKKLNLPYFKCYRVYLELLNLSNVGEFLRTLSRFRKEKENSSSYVHFIYNVPLGGFTS